MKFEDVIDEASIAERRQSLFPWDEQDAVEQARSVATQRRRLFRPRTETPSMRPRREKHTPTDQPPLDVPMTLKIRKQQQQQERREAQLEEVPNMIDKKREQKQLVQEETIEVEDVREEQDEPSDEEEDHSAHQHKSYLPEELRSISTRSFSIFHDDSDDEEDRDRYTNLQDSKEEVEHSKMSFSQAIQESHQSPHDEGSFRTRGAAGLFSKSFESIKKDQHQVVCIYRQFGPPSVLTLETSAPPVDPAPTHVVLKVQASTVRRTDCTVRKGLCTNLWYPTCVPGIPGTDVVGHVVHTGSQVTEWTTGDRVAATLPQGGGNARYVTVQASSLVSVPRALDSAKAVCMVNIYSTAYQTLQQLVSRDTLLEITTDTQKSTKKKKRTFTLHRKQVLILGGMDVVAQALVQMCLKAGATVYASAPEERHKYVETVLRAKPVEDPHTLAGQMDICLDGLCQPNVALSVLKPKGRVVRFGHDLLSQPYSTWGAPTLAYWTEWWSNVWHSQVQDAASRKNLESLFSLLSMGKIKPHIAKRIGLEEVPAFHASLEADTVRGIVVCFPWMKRNGLYEA